MVREYIGARYVPKFMGNYDNTQEYEALCVVDNGAGTSYITKIPTPAGTPLTNTTYWAIYGASSGAIVNLQNQIDTINGDIDVLDNKAGAVKLEKFRNKTICIVGDSISDESTYQPNWVDAFTEIVTNANIDATVHNASVTGATLLGIGRDSITTIPTGYDIYIIALGVNDFQGQFMASELRDAIYNIIDRVDLSNADRRAYYVSPISAYVSTYTNFYTPLDAYRHFCESLFSNGGFTIISGRNVPNLNVNTQLSFLADRLHPASIFRYIYANYIIDAINSGVSTFTNGCQYQKVCEIHADVTYSQGGTYLTWMSPVLARISVNMTGVQLTANTWVNFAYLRTPSGYNGLLNTAIGNFVTYTGDVIQARITNGILQLAASETKSYTLSGAILAAVLVEYSVN